MLVMLTGKVFAGCVGIVVPNKKGNSNGAGRKKGVPNKKTSAVKEMLNEMGCDPIEGMARIALEAKKRGDTELEAKMYKELAPYHSSRLSATTIDASVTTEKTHEERLKELEKDDDE